MEEVDGSNPSRSTTTFQTPTSLPVTNHDSGAIQTLCVAAAHPERANGTAAAVLDAVTRHDVVPHHLRQFLAYVRPVHPGGDENGDGLAPNTGRLQGLEQGRQNDLVGHRPRDIGDDNAGAGAAAGDLCERRALNRMGQRIAHGGRGVGQRRKRLHLQHYGGIGEFEVYLRAPTLHIGLHCHEYNARQVDGMQAARPADSYDASRSRPSFTFPSGNTAYISSRPPIASTKFSSVLSERAVRCFSWETAASAISR